MAEGEKERGEVGRLERGRNGGEMNWKRKGWEGTEEGRKADRREIEGRESKGEG